MALAGLLGGFGEHEGELVGVAHGLKNGARPSTNTIPLTPFFHICYDGIVNMLDQVFIITRILVEEVVAGRVLGGLDFEMPIAVPDGAGDRVSLAGLALQGLLVLGGLFCDFLLRAFDPHVTKLNVDILRWDFHRL